MDPIIAPAILAVNRRRDAPAGYLHRMSDMGKRARALRKALGLTQVELAKRAGVSQPAISDLERGDTSKLMGGTLAGVARALRTNPDWLLTGKGTPAPLVHTDIDEQELLAIFRALPDAQREALLTVARGMHVQTPAAASAVNPYPRRRSISPTE